MTSGTKPTPNRGRILGWVLVAALTLDTVAAAEPTSVAPKPTTASLIASLAQESPARTTFAEVRWLDMLERPLVLTGELAWLGGDRLQRKVTSPYAEITRIVDGTVTVQREHEEPRTFSLDRSPELASVLGSFRALLSGDAAAVDEVFTSRAKRDGEHWKLVLEPRDPRIKQRIVGLVVYGKSDKLRCLRMDEADGDLSITLLGELATVPIAEAPDAVSLLRRCAGDSDPTNAVRANSGT